MSIKINLGSTPHRWDKDARVFFFSEKHVSFSTEYEIINPTTGNSETFIFSHSTGPEFDPKTEWIYTNAKLGIHMSVGNDPKITAANAKAYLNAKTKI